MKLRNKKTGEIMDDAQYRNFSLNDGFGFRNGDKEYYYHSLAELNEEWEDYEEPSKTIWQIKDSGELQDFEEDDFSDGYIESSKSIGNYFETREEAEKAVEKLKAWKRLRDKGFRFVGFRTIGKVIDFHIPKKYYRAFGGKQFSIEKSLELFNDLKLIFGGEE